MSQKSGSFYIIVLFFTTPLLQECSGQCDPNYSTFDCGGEALYYCVYDNNQDWYGARDMCWADGGRLARIPDSTTQDCIAANIPQNDYFINAWFEYPWTWSNGDPIQDFFWKKGEPSAGRGSDAEYIYLSGEGDDKHAWADVSNQKYGCVCETQDCPSTGIFLEYAQKCYVFSDVGRSWSDSDNFCNVNGVLASVDTADLQAAIVNHLTKNIDQLKIQNFWIGGWQNTGQSREWQYDDGTKDSPFYTDLCVGCHPTGGVPECAFLDQKFDYKWNIEPCKDEKLRFICEFDSATSTLNPTSQLSSTGQSTTFSQPSSTDQTFSDSLTSTFNPTSEPSSTDQTFSDSVTSTFNPTSEPSTDQSTTSRQPSSTDQAFSNSVTSTLNPTSKSSSTDISTTKKSLPSSTEQPFSDSATYTFNPTIEPSLDLLTIVLIAVSVTLFLILIIMVVIIAALLHKLKRIGAVSNQRMVEYPNGDDTYELPEKCHTPIYDQLNKRYSDEAAVPSRDEIKISNDEDYQLLENSQTPIYEKLNKNSSNGANTMEENHGG